MEPWFQAICDFYDVPLRAPTVSKRPSSNSDPQLPMQAQLTTTSHAKQRSCPVSQKQLQKRDWLAFAKSW
jgi:hypothetical protein